VGLDIGSSSIKAVELRSTKAGYELVSFEPNHWRRIRWSMARSWTRPGGTLHHKIFDAEDEHWHLGRVHDRAIDHRILRQWFGSETHQFIARFGGSQLYGLDRAGPDIEPTSCLFFVRPVTTYSRPLSLSPRQTSGALRALGSSCVPSSDPGWSP